MKRNLMLNYLVAMLCSLFFLNDCFAYVVIAIEKSSVLFATDNKVVQEKGNYKIYYEIDEENSIVKRVKLVALKDIGDFVKKGEVIPDNTIYKIIRPPQTDITTGENLIQAVGQPGLSATELLTIGEKYIMFSKSTGGYVIVSLLEIVETTKISTKNEKKDK